MYLELRDVVRPTSHPGLLMAARQPTSTSTKTIVSTHTSTLILASTTSKPNYTGGLDGTNQLGNYFFINLLVTFFALLALLIIIIRLYMLACNYIRQMFASGPGSQYQTHFTVNATSYWPWIKRHILYAPLWRCRHNQEMQLSSAISIGTLPSRLHQIILGLYLVSNIIYCTILDYTEPRTATLAELRGRSGSLAAFNMIPMILFAMRGSPLISTLKVSYDTFNLFHRGLARIVLFESIVHISAWGATCLLEKNSPSAGELIHEYISLQWATVGLVTFCVMSILAWSPIRHAFYETFLNFHKLFAFVAILGVYEHLELSQLPQVSYVVLAAIFWAVDWVIRAATMVYYNYSRWHRTTIKIEALPNEACRLTFELARTWKYRPGAHAHVYLPRVGWWSSHPFSIAWSEDCLLQDSDEDKDIKTIPTLDLDKPSKVRTTVSLVVRARAGMTRQLYERATTSQNKVVFMNGCIEGPYGGHESLDSYGTVLLFAGGVGITHQLGYVRHLVQGYEMGTVAARKVILVWSIPQIEHLEWVRPWMDEVLRMPGRREVLKVLIFVTKGTASASSKTGTVVVARGRCNVQQTVDEEFLERQGAMVTTVCGPGAFADDVRRAVRKRVQLGNLDFIEEAFTY